MALLEGFTGEGASSLGDGVARHWAKFLDRDFRSVRYIFYYLTSPACVILRGRLVVFVRLRRGGFCIGLHVVVKG